MTGDKGDTSESIYPLNADLSLTIRFIGELKPPASPASPAEVEP